MNQSSYIGEELDIFAKAVNWKAYLNSFICPYLKGDVLEVGAGQGGTTFSFFNDTIKRWVCLEPDKELINKIPEENKRIEKRLGIIDDITVEEKFNAIVYIDVLEHIEDDLNEVKKALSRIRVGGHLVIMCPAHQMLYSPFDEQLGHFRRYTKEMLLKLMPATVEIVQNKYLDSCGFFLSLANRCILKSSTPTLSQIKFWDNIVIPLSRPIDFCTFYHFGKSVLIVAKKISE